jgi:type VI secretion system protein ImpC
MSEAKTKTEAAAATTTVSAQPSLLEQAISNTKQTAPDDARALISNLVDEALQGSITWSKNVSETIQKRIDAIDAALSKQLAAIMHAPAFQKLESTWRGLRYLVYNSETGTTMKIKVMNVAKKDLYKDLDSASEFDQSQTFKKLYEDEFGNPGGEPYGTLIGDYEFTNHPDDIDLLGKMSKVAAAALCPFISSASAQLFGFENFTELKRPRDLKKDMSALEYLKWNAFRDSEDSRWVTLAMPRVLSRLPYGSMTKPIPEFNFEEVELDGKGKAKPVDHEHYAWMNAAWALGQRLTHAFSKYGWCTAIRGAEGGGKVEGLPAHIFTSDDGDPDLKCPAEIGITDRREKELSDCGFLPLCHYKNTDFAVFFGAQSCQRPKKYDVDAATSNAAISARLPYLMAVSRIGHYLKVIGRDKIGSFMEVEDCKDWLNRWIAQYVCLDPKPTPEMKAKYPLAQAEIRVEEVPGSPGAYNAVAYLRPWLQLEELNASLRLVSRIPQMKK